jgi:hypothetical protein
MHRVGVGTVARQMRFFDAHPEQALALLLTGSCFVYESWKALRDPLGQLHLNNPIKNM